MQQLGLPVPGQAKTMRFEEIIEMNRPLAIILVASYMNEETGRVSNGGRPRLVRDLARHLRDKGFAVRIVQKGSADAMSLCNHGLDVQTVRAPSRAWGDIIYSWRTRRLQREASLCCYASPEDGFPFFSNRSIAIQHGIWWDEPIYGLCRRSVIRVTQLIRNLAMVRRVRATVCVDSNFANVLRLYGGIGHRAAAKCHYIPNYSDISAQPPPNDDTIRQRFAARQLLFLRRFEEPRGPLLFVEVCRALERSGVEFTGHMVGWGRQAPAIKERLGNLGLSRKVLVYEASLDETELVLHGSSISVVPTQWSEGTSLSAVESIAAGIPVVSTDVGGLPNVVVPGFNGLTSPARADVLADCVRRLLADEALYFTMARNCLAMREALSLDRWKADIDRVLGHAGLIPGSDAPHDAGRVTNESLLAHFDAALRR